MAVPSNPAPKPAFPPALWARALVLLTGWEAFRSKPYICPTGHWTIGIGSTVAADGRPVTASTPTVTRAQAEAMALRDMTLAAGIVDRVVKVPLQPHQRLALAFLLHNVGQGLRGKKDGIVTLEDGRPSTLLRKLNAGDYAGAAAQFDAWNKGTENGVFGPLGGLTKRRAAERAIFEGKGL